MIVEEGMKDRGAWESKYGFEAQITEDKLPGKYVWRNLGGLGKPALKSKLVSDTCSWITQAVSAQAASISLSSLCNTDPFLLVLPFSARTVNSLSVNSFCI